MCETQLVQKDKAKKEEPKKEPAAKKKEADKPAQEEDKCDVDSLIKGFLDAIHKEQKAQKTQKPKSEYDDEKLIEKFNETKNDFVYFSRLYAKNFHVCPWFPWEVAQSTVVIPKNWN